MCAVCTLPFEYCEYGPCPKECLKKNGKAAYAQSASASKSSAAGDEKKKPKKPAGLALLCFARGLR